MCSDPLSDFILRTWLVKKWQCHWTPSADGGSCLLLQCCLLKYHIVSLKYQIWWFPRDWWFPHVSTVPTLATAGAEGNQQNQVARKTCFSSISKQGHKMAQVQQLSCFGSWSFWANKAQKHAETRWNKMKQTRTEGSLTSSLMFRRHPLDMSHFCHSSQAPHSTTRMERKRSCCRAKPPTHTTLCTILCPAKYCEFNEGITKSRHWQEVTRSLLNHHKQ